MVARRTTDMTTTHLDFANLDLVKLAAGAYIARQERRDYPIGQFDKTDRWYPAPEERQACCDLVRASRLRPYSLLVHCRSVEHVAALYGVDPAALRQAVRAARAGEDAFEERMR
jgi:hypothetical protein